MFLGCVDTDSIGLGSIGGTTDPITESEKSGIFSEDVVGNTVPKHVGGIYLSTYEVIYNNGNTMKIFYDGELYKVRSEQVGGIQLQIKRTAPNHEAYRVSLENGKPTEYVYSYTNYDEECRILDQIYWDAAGRVDPRSDGDIDRANKFIEAGLKKGKQVKERYYAKELGAWN